MTALILHFPTTKQWSVYELETLYQAAEVASYRRIISDVEIFSDDEGNPAFGFISHQGDAFQIITRIARRYLILNRKGDVVDSDKDLPALLDRSFCAGGNPFATTGSY